MCWRVDCPKCGRPGYGGCGAHVEQVLGRVPAAERCRCRESKAAQAKTEGARPEVGSGRASWARRLLGS